MEREFDQASTDRLLAALYDEDAETAEALSGEERRELSSLQELRSLFSSIPDEEPPSSVTAKLLAAAAAPPRKSVSPIAEPGLWSRFLAWMQPVFAHPGLAAAASLVLVATIGGVFYVTGRGDSAAVKRDEAPAASRGAPAPEAREDGLTNFEPGTERDQDEGVPAATEEKALQLDAAKSGGVPGRTEKPAAATVAPAKTPRFKTRATTKGNTGNAGTGGGNGEKAALDVTATTEIDLGGSLGTSPPPPPSPADGVRGAPEPRPQQQTDRPADKRAVSKDTKSDKKSGENRQKAKEEAESLSRLRNQARAAAKKGNCNSVRQLGKTVRQRDDGYYKKVFVTDGAIRRCYQTLSK